MADWLWAGMAGWMWVGVAGCVDVHLCSCCVLVDRESEEETGQVMIICI